MHGGLILTPRKELCMQVYEEIAKIDPKQKVRVARLSPNDRLLPQVTHPKPGEILEDIKEPLSMKLDFKNQNLISMINWRLMDILIATPSMLRNNLEVYAQDRRGALNPRFIVIDEFDDIMNRRGVFNDLKSVLEEINQSRKELSPESKSVYALSGASMLQTHNKKRTESVLNGWIPQLNYARTDEYLKINPDIEHEAFNTDSLSKREKFLMVLQVIAESNAERILVFCESTEISQELSEYLTSKLILSKPLHSGMTDSEREDALNGMRRGKYMTLVATDIGSRGLDFQDMSLVIQYDFAKDGVNLLHRFGRTGRMGKKGKVVSFVEFERSSLYHAFEEARLNGNDLSSIIGRKGSFKRRHREEVIADN